MTTLAHTLIDFYEALVALVLALVAKRWPELSEWWSSTFQRFLASNCRQLVLRVGRRGGKSSSLCRLAVAFALAYDARLIPPGDIGVVAFISTRQDEATQRLRTIKGILAVLGVKWKPIENGIELVDRPIAFKVFPASVAGVSGFTAILIIADEVAKWRDSDTGSNPATEVLASVRPTMATQRAARIVLSSSPVGNEDAHAKAFDAGDDDFQMTAFAETWIANPTITEAETHADEPDSRIWAREYAAIPQAGALSAFDAEAIDRARSHPRPSGDRGPRYLLLDPSSGRKDAFTWGVISWVTPGDAPPYIDVELVDGIEARFFDHGNTNRMIDKPYAAALEHGCRVALADQREALMMAAAFAARNAARRAKDETARGIAYVTHDWTAQSKPLAVEKLRRWFADDAIALPKHDKLRRELLSFEEKITSAGAFTFGARGSGHDDYVALLITAAMSDLAGGLTSGPTHWPTLNRGGPGGEPPVLRSASARFWPGGGRGF